LSSHTGLNLERCASPDGYIALMWRTGEPGLRGRARHFAYLLEAMLLTRLMTLAGVQHLHNHFGENSATVAMLASCISGIPYSMTIHGCYIFFHPRRWALGEKIARSRFTACVSHYSMSQCMVFTPEQAWGRMYLVRCCVAPEFLSATITPVPEAPRFVFVGRFCAEKGIPLLLEAVRRLSSDGVDIHLAMIGDGPLREGIAARIGELGLTNSVTLSGNQDSSYVRHAIRNSRALVLPSLAEGLPVVLMEAMALGRPVIATRVGGVGELVEHDLNGWLVDPASVDGLAEALREALSSPTNRLEAMGRAGAARVAELHDVRKEATKLAALFRDGTTGKSGE
ncbi:MAG TPA: glycosyltransferase, partial [Planctomycetota bacterium]|nr:glycosyltransferase [Planctomycetota bacterium]HRR79119.1 glycosyltransferase [Planctomycetota bacterium]HRT97656.1 glycosyltransferase [Planctomycetota bacterium]